MMFRLLGMTEDVNRMAKIVSTMQIDRECDVRSGDRCPYVNEQLSQLKRWAPPLRRLLRPHRLLRCHQQHVFRCPAQTPPPSPNAHGRCSHSRQMWSTLDVRICRVDA